MAKEETALKQEKDLVTEEMVKVMDDSNIPRLVIAGRTFYRRDDNYPRVVEKEALFEDLRRHDRGDMIQETVNSQRLRSYCKELNDENQPIPAGVDIFTKCRIGIRG